ncbi:MAG: VWA domain-containing protein [Pyrinomonadaceae bacterium]|nr:VWA domain-containing protein [Pyrinomonadaceae bacterium]
MKNFFYLVLCLSAFSILSFAQTPTPTPKSVENDDVVKISTNLIQVDVTVTDKNGKIVTDLKPEDFEIFENNEKQTITNFSFVNSVTQKVSTQKINKNEAAIPLTPVQIQPGQVRRTIALVVDDLGLSAESIQTVKRALRKFVDEQMQPNDLVAVILTGKGIGALSQFTSDKNLLYSAIDKIRWNPVGRGGISAFTAVEPTLQEIIANNSATPRTNTSQATSDAIQAEKDRTTAFNELREDIFAVGTLGAIKYVVKGMGELPGRKSIMLFSDGFSICTDTDMKKGDGRCEQMQAALQRLTDLCNRAAVTIYSQDARGLAYVGMGSGDNISLITQNINQSVMERTEELRDKQQGLSYLAKETGGRATFGSNDLNLGLEKMLGDTQGYYLIAYQPDSDTFDAKTSKFNKLLVKVKKDGLNVRYRSGFFGIADSEIRRNTAQKETPLQQILKPLTSPFTVNEINLKLNTVFAKDDKNTPFLHSFLHIDARDLQFTEKPDGTKEATFDILAISYGEDGKIVEQVGKNYTITAKKGQFESLLNDGFVYNFVFPIKNSGAYQMRVALRDAANAKVGSASQFIEVPDLKKGNLTLSGIVLESLTEPQWRERNSATNQLNLMQDTSLRRFKRGTILSYSTEIYNAKLDQSNKPNLQTQIRIFRDGKIVLNGKLNPFTADGNKLNFAGALGLGKEMQVGDYVLQIVVIDNLAKSKQKIATQWVQFELMD